MRRIAALLVDHLCYCLLHMTNYILEYHVTRLEFDLILCYGRPTSVRIGPRVSLFTRGRNRSCRCSWPGALDILSRQKQIHATLELLSEHDAFYRHVHCCGRGDMSCTACRCVGRKETEPHSAGDGVVSIERWAACRSPLCL